MKLLTTTLMLLGSFSLFAADFCVATPFSGSKSFKHSYHIDCGQGIDRFLKDSSLKKNIAKKNLFSEMSSEGLSYVGTFPRRGQLLFSSSHLNMQKLCIAYPASSNQTLQMDVFKIDCNDNAAILLYTNPIKLKGFLKSRYLPDEAGKAALKYYMTTKGYSPLASFEVIESWLGYFSYLFERD